MPPLYIPCIGPFLPVLVITLIPLFFPRVGPKKRLARVVPGLLPGYSRVIPVLSRVKPCYLSGHGSQATQNVPYSSILSTLTRIKPCCSPCCSRVPQYCPVLPRVALYIPVLIQVIPVLFPGYYAFFQHRD